jgi:hypothetical protein
MTKKKPRYESRVFDGRIIHSAEIERIHKEVLDFKHIEAVSEPMRELIEDLWPELVNKLTAEGQLTHGYHDATDRPWHGAAGNPPAWSFKIPVPDHGRGICPMGLRAGRGNMPAACDGTPNTLRCGFRAHGGVLSGATRLSSSRP